MPSSIEVSSAGSSSLVRSSNDDEQTLRPVLSFLSVSAPVGVFSPSAPQLPHCVRVEPELLWSFRE